MTMMQAIEIAAPGGPDMLRPVERPIPQPGPGEVLVRVQAAGVNGADLAQRRGVYPPPEGESDIPGLEISGTIAALGAGVAGLRPGQPVCALLAGGGYAQYCAVPAGQVLPLPDGIDAVSGAALMEGLATVWANVFDLGRLQPGETLLVHGGSSGIGTTAIQLARLHGARVIVTAGSSEKLRACRALGAEIAINYRTEDFAAIASQRENRADVILDMVGGPYLAANLRCLAPRGRLVVIAFQGGRFGELDIARVMMQGLTVTGSTLRNRPRDEKARLVDELRQRVWPLVAGRQFQPVIDSTWRLSDAAQAHIRMESGQHIGKIVLTVG